MSAVVVTGGGSPLGRKLSKKFLQQGLDVISVVRPHHDAKNSVKPIAGLRMITDDLPLAGDIDNVCEIIKMEFPQVWAFVHAAPSSEPDNNDLTKLCGTFIENVFSSWIIADACATKMFNGGRIFIWALLDINLTARRVWSLMRRQNIYWGIFHDMSRL